MRSFRLLNITAAAVLIAMIVAIAIVLMENRIWTNALVTSIAVLSISTAFIFFLPSLMGAKNDSTDARQIASIGPLSAVVFALLVCAAGAVWLAVLGKDTLSKALDIFCIGTFVLSILLLRAALNVVSSVTNQYSNPSKHINWQSQLNIMCGTSTDKVSKESLIKFSEKLRYVASDVPGGSPQDRSIELLITNLQDQLTTNSDSNILDSIFKIETLIAQREVFLKSARNKA